MAFVQSALGKMGGVNGFNFWVYDATQGDDDKSDVAGADYFDAITHGMLRVNDVILAACDDGVALFAVETADAGNIVVGDAIDLNTAVT